MAKICSNCACYEVCIYANPNRKQDCNLWQPEVVRCKDCKHSADDDCDAFYCVKWDKWEMPEDFFCGYGKRRTDDI